MLKNKDLEQAFKGAIYLEMDLIYNPVSLAGPAIPPNFSVCKVKDDQPGETQICVKRFRNVAAREREQGFKPQL